MKIYLQEDRELPVVTGSILVRTGSAFDPPERIGLAQLTGTVLRTGGTTLKTGDQVDDMLEGLARQRSKLRSARPRVASPSSP